MLNPPTPMSQAEIDELLARDVLARLATIDRHGFPHVTPMWFGWHDGAVLMTSLADRPHLRRLEHNPHAGVCVDVEDPFLPDGGRPNRQVRVFGLAEMFPDEGSKWTDAITHKYVHGPAAAARVAETATQDRVVISLRPTRLLAVSSV